MAASVSAPTALDVIAVPITQKNILHATRCRRSKLEPWRSNSAAAIMTGSVNAKPISNRVSVCAAPLSPPKHSTPSSTRRRKQTRWPWSPALRRRLAGRRLGPPRRHGATAAEFPPTRPRCSQQAAIGRRLDGSRQSRTIAAAEHVPAIGCASRAHQGSKGSAWIGTSRRMIHPPQAAMTAATLCTPCISRQTDYR